MARNPMITIKADFNHTDGQGRLILSDLVIHETTPFADLASAAEAIIFRQGEDIVYGRLIEDPVSGWVGDPDWDSQDVLAEYPQPAEATA